MYGYCRYEYGYNIHVYDCHVNCHYLYGYHMYCQLVHSYHVNRYHINSYCMCRHHIYGYHGIHPAASLIKSLTARSMLVLYTTPGMTWRLDTYIQQVNVKLNRLMNSLIVSFCSCISCNIYSCKTFGMSECDAVIFIQWTLVKSFYYVTINTVTC